ncbi:MliC family protein [Methylocystis iwaonis]|uniref:MliC family protein n=1 Tax=Methylocystis iwaonis TaxID=2885079 RepID=UPI002E7BDCA7|nr:MliC family protein [Methylocystis iwaonis]
MIRAAAIALLSFISIGFAAATPMECAKTSRAPVKFICEDATLEGLDKEASRLADLAAMGTGMTAARKKDLAQSQASFRKTLSACKDAKPCLQRTLIERIYRLRQGYADVRSKDAEGTSLGPFIASCPGLDGLLDVTFVNVAPALAFLSWRDKSVVLQQALAASGARYTGAFGAGEAQFWNKGNEATLDLPGRPPLNCTMQDVGAPASAPR